ncbi:hypothetical protein [Aliihoeflea sp. 2WW]|uniref:hypothetical protein n=1 Tax=Aliihoeflea sp. 2WW TaxID=1381123 RepID=UPI0004BB91F1|nr:hypothetical protein [Aliihoeflea sp. 2WW]
MQHTSGKAEVDRFYESLDERERAAVLKGDEQLEAAEGTDTEITFVKGEALLSVHTSVSVGTFSKWCSVRWAYHRSYAYKYMRVARRLSGFRRRIVAAQVERATVMELASKPEKVEELLAIFEAGRRLTFAKAKAIIAAGGPDQGQVEGGAEQGGPKGIRRLHAAKRSHIPELAGRLEGIVRSIEDALAAPRVQKGSLARKVVMEARQARAEFFNLCSFVHAPDATEAKRGPIEFPVGSRWRQVTNVLYDLGGIDLWPAKKDLAAWLHEMVLPPLRWAARAEEPATDLDQVSDVDAGRLAGGPTKKQAPSPTSDEYDLLMSDAGEGDACEILTSASSEWMHATPLAGFWIDAEGRTMAAINSRAVRRVPREDISKAVEFLVFLRQHFISRGTSPAETDEACRQTADVLSDLMVCGRRVEELPGPSSRLRAQVATALVWRARRESGHPVSQTGSGSAR